MIPITTVAKCVIFNSQTVCIFLNVNKKSTVLKDLQITLSTGNSSDIQTIPNIVNMNLTQIMILPNVKDCAVNISILQPGLTKDSKDNKSTQFNIVKTEKL